ncbi:restriction endonuclease subunit S [Methanosarcina sp.]|uniref:restriction endonuclease subunit S n=1 Tax=Methanosarcina sp. TaxID=2213 RepID=UPI002988379D|nr:restriction endonuclease subunit S [Methanosarcina sp.]MDW5551486.1 restriction endonuclease subunit S [Methanosarcina sp.]MDW5554400.1 restriction endonuclease subunit S [Methanosarcina sp.]MDW5560615.1 restriction endonuclease subunit S [Methanosarcina sp.]
MSAECSAENIPPGYKQTEVGVIPEDWDFDYIENLSHITTGARNTQDRVDDGLYPFFVRSQTVERINSYSFDGEAVLTAGDGVGTGKVFHYINGKFDAHQRVYRISDFNERINGYFFYLYFSNHFYNRIMQMTAKSSVDSVRREMIARMLIPTPSKIEQVAIAESLSDTDALLESLEQLIAKKRQIKQGAMQELLTGKRRLPGFSGEWEVKQFGEIVQPRKERIDPRRTAVQEFCIELEHIEQGTGCLVGCTATEESSSLKSVFQKDDVLFGKLRAYLRKYWLADREGVCSTEIWVLIAKRSLLTPHFLFQLVQVDRFVEIASLAYGTHMPRSDWNVVKNYEVYLPPLEEQETIATILSDMDSEITALEEKLAKARQIKQGMMQELLTGKIRLI